MRASSLLSPFAGAALLLALACGSTQKISAPPASFSEAQAQAARTHKPILIDFFATW